jgi:hypothetical protein
VGDGGDAETDPLREFSEVCRTELRALRR